MPLPAVVKVTVTGTAEAPLKVMVLSAAVPSATVLGALMVMIGVTGTVTLGSHASLAAAVHAGSPPPERLAVLLPFAAVVATFTGMRTMMVPVVAPVSIWQFGPIALPVLVPQFESTPLDVPPVFVGAPESVTPVASVSLINIGAVVGPLAMVMVMS